MSQPLPLQEIVAEFEELRNKPVKIGNMIQLRHSLTANISYNLYGSGDREEGRKALNVRNLFDQHILNASAEDMVDGNLGGLNEFKKGLTLENLAEQLEILEDIEKHAQASGLKNALVALIMDPDKMMRFNQGQRELLKKGATGLPFFAKGRFQKVMRSIQNEAMQSQ